jgi:hypothetical protein
MDFKKERMGSTAQYSQRVWGVHETNHADENILVYHSIWNLQIIQDSNFACGFVWVRNFVSDIKGRTQTEGVCEQMKWQEVEENCITRSFITCTLRQV